MSEWKTIEKLKKHHTVKNKNLKAIYIDDNNVEQVQKETDCFSIFPNKKLLIGALSFISYPCYIIWINPTSHERSKYYFTDEYEFEEYFKFKEEQQMNTLDQLVEQVQQWSIDKDLHNGNSDRQALKFYEEAGEVASALSRGQMDALKDGIGDTVVTLIILAQQHDMTLQECLQYAYDEIKGRKGKTINGTFIKEADLKE